MAGHLDKRSTNKYLLFTLIKKINSMSPWEMVAELGIYTEEQIEEMTWAECVEIINQEENEK